MRPLTLSLIIACLYLSATVNAQSYVTLYEDCNYAGKKYFLEPGSYRMYAMRIGNDRLSSLQVPQGLRVTLYTDDNFRGNSHTVTANTSCLDAGWDNNTSSIVVESTGPVYNPNDYVIFYQDCFQRGYSRTLRPGTYTGSELAELKYNISSFTIFGNLQIKAYVNNENATGFNTVFFSNENCLSGNFNDKIGSLVIEARQPGSGLGQNQSLATFYTNCNYDGNSIRLQPGSYTGEKLGLFRYDISSVEIPSGLRVRVYSDDNLMGSSLVIDQNERCLSSSLNDRIGSLSVETTRSGGWPNSGPAATEVILYADASFRGQSATVLPGSYPSLAQIGFPDKNLSSLTVPSGFRVIIYEYENFGGKSYTITDTRSSLNFTGWNDRASSIKVIRDR